MRTVAGYTGVTENPLGSERKNLLNHSHKLIAANFIFFISQGQGGATLGITVENICGFGKNR